MDRFNWSGRKKVCRTSIRYFAVKVAEPCHIGKAHILVVYSFVVDNLYGSTTNIIHPITSFLSIIHFAFFGHTFHVLPFVLPDVLQRLRQADERMNHEIYLIRLMNPNCMWQNRKNDRMKNRRYGFNKPYRLFCMVCVTCQHFCFYWPDHLGARVSQ